MRTPLALGARVRLGSLLCLLGSASFLRCTGPTPARPFFFAKRVAHAEADFDPLQFRSVRKDGLLSSQVTMAGETQLSLTPPLPSRLTYAIQIPADPALTFSIGAALLGVRQLPAPVDFELHIDSGAGEELIFSDTIRRAHPNRWMDREVDLSRWAKQKVRLTFETKLGNIRGRPRKTSARGLVLASWGNPVLISAGARRDGPNLILISVDCLRADHVGAYGYQRNTTPRIDQFARDGVVFETSLASSSWTLPTHMSMLTGLPPSFHGATKQRQLDDSIPYLPELLGRSGYQTHGIVSWVYLSQAFGFERGFHTYEVLDRPRAVRIVDAAVEVLRQASSRKLFLFLHFFDPHRPYLPPKDFEERFGPRPRDISALLDKVAKGIPPTRMEETDEITRLYDAEIAYTDEMIGRLFDELEALGLYEDSLIIITSDHGEAFFEHDHWEHSQTLYEEIIRTPLIVKWPGSAPIGRRKDPVSQVDIFPTLVEAAGAELPWTDARTLAATDGGRPHISSEITWLSPNGTFMKVSFHTGREKYIATLAGPAGKPLGELKIIEEELYDLTDDPSERDNLLGKPEFSGDRETFRRHVHTFLDEARRFRASHGGQEVLMDEQTRERLKTLGYIQ